MQVVVTRRVKAMPWTGSRQGAHRKSVCPASILCRAFHQVCFEGCFLVCLFVFLDPLSFEFGWQLMLNAIMCTFLQNTRTKLEENILTNRQTEKASKQDKQTITSTSKGTGVRRGGRRDVNHFRSGRGCLLIAVSCISRQGRYLHFHIAWLLLLLLLLFCTDSKLQAMSLREEKSCEKHYT